MGASEWTPGKAQGCLDGGGSRRGELDAGIGEGSIFGVVQLILSWEKKQKLGKLAFLEQVLAIWGCHLVSWAGGCREWVSSLLYMVWLLSVYVYPVSR